jgi:hypothetical protein
VPKIEEHPPLRQRWGRGHLVVATGLAMGFEMNWAMESAIGFGAMD